MTFIVDKGPIRVTHVAIFTMYPKIFHVKTSICDGEISTVFASELYGLSRR